MTITFDGRSELVEPAARAILGAIDLGDGGTAKQRRLLESILTTVWERPDLEVARLSPLSPVEVAECFDTALVRKRLLRFLVLFEYCRYPFSERQVELVDSYAVALGDDGSDEGLRLARVFLDAGLPQVAADVKRLSYGLGPQLPEVSIAERYSVMGMRAPELVEALHEFASLPPGTLGREYHDFYVRHGFTFPGDGPETPSFLVRHDMCHVLAGYGPSAPEELALAAFQLGMHDSDPNWNFLVAILAALELGLFDSEEFEAKTGILDRDGAMELLLDGFVRGTRCTGDLAAMDHLAEAAVPVDAIRERFGVPPRES